jgi:hypothetical protein
LPKLEQLHRDGARAPRRDGTLSGTRSQASIGSSFNAFTYAPDQILETSLGDNDAIATEHLGDGTARCTHHDAPTHHGLDDYAWPLILPCVRRPRGHDGDIDRAPIGGDLVWKKESVDPLDADRFGSLPHLALERPSSGDRCLDRQWEPRASLRPRVQEEQWALLFNEPPSEADDDSVLRKTQPLPQCGAFLCSRWRAELRGIPRIRCDDGRALWTRETVLYGGLEGGRGLCGTSIDAREHITSECALRQSLR